MKKFKLITVLMVIALIATAFSACGKCTHEYENGSCINSGEACSHVFSQGACTVCELPCSHEYENGEKITLTQNEWNTLYMQYLGNIGSTHFNVYTKKNEGLTFVSISITE